MAQAAGVNVAYKGDCTKQCGNLMYLPACPPDEVCDFKSCDTAVGECVKKATPQECQVLSGPVVCGCDNKTCATDCERILAGVALSHPGACQPMVTVVTDKTSYDPGEQVEVTLTNGTSQSVFLPGCAVYSWHRKEGGVWVDKGPTMLCSWEGITKEVTAGGTLVETTQNKAGTWRLKTEYGVGCMPGQPLSAAGCGAFVMASPTRSRSCRRSRRASRSRAATRPRSPPPRTAMSATRRSTASTSCWTGTRGGRAWPRCPGPRGWPR